ncbi:hypothetical protein HZH66_013597 [Vespula vulgaris]|uniref:Uncharacterized protein n=1 Tax=Vespula vulgaris TaxID=7454 RepID=A0A834J635_VESVU|nr:hypothetical protein HZH66_013597 [Vespula vulgaris]
MTQLDYRTYASLALFMKKNVWGRTITRITHHNVNELRDGIGDVRWVMRLKERNNKQSYNRKLRQSKRQKVWSKLSINYLLFNKRYASPVTIPVTYRLMRKELFRFGGFDEQANNVFTLESSGK